MKKENLRAMFPRLYQIYTVLRIRLTNIYWSIADERKYPNKLSKMYKKKVGESLDWNNLISYTEKMQWAKLYDNNTLKTTLSDKYQVRDWVSKTIGEEYLIPLLGVWDSFDEIDFNKLPDKFVLKTNHGSGTNIIVKDKSKLDLKEARRKLNNWMRMNFAFDNGLELQYKDIKPKIIAEEYIGGNDIDLRDYKFFCFDGEVYYLWVDVERYTNHQRNIYDINWEQQEWSLGLKTTEHPLPKPDNFDLMVELVKKMCKGFSHVRVDLYNVDGKIYFGEMTFTCGSGFFSIHPHKYNIMLGELWKLPIGSTTE